MPTKLVYDGYFKIIAHTRGDGLGQYEVVVVTDVINLLVHNRTTNTVVLVRQPRYAMITDENPEGLITETIGGRFDRPLSVFDLIIAEASEEAGAHLSQSDIELLNNGRPMAISAGMTTEKAYLAYVCITSDQIDQKEKVFGVAEEGEQIERIHIPVPEFLEMEVEDVRLFALQQFLKTKVNE